MPSATNKQKNKIIETAYDACMPAAPSEWDTIIEVKLSGARTELSAWRLMAGKLRNCGCIVPRRGGDDSDVTTVQNQYVGAIYDFYIADANLKRATGNLNETATH